MVVSYNLPGNPALKFDGETLANIYLGKITKWNDPAIAKLNPGVTLPDLAIVTVQRADGSGTNYIFTDYLSSVSPAFKEKVGVSTAVEWPGGVGAKGNDGVAGQIRQTSGANRLRGIDLRVAEQDVVRRSQEQGRRLREGIA